jgi:hypothetical protein
MHEVSKPHRKAIDDNHGLRICYLANRLGQVPGGFHRFPVRAALFLVLLYASAHFLVGYLGGGYEHAAAEFFGQPQRFFAFAAAGTAGDKNHFSHLGHLFPPRFLKSGLLRAKDISGLPCKRRYVYKDSSLTNATVS